MLRPFVREVSGNCSFCSKTVFEVQSLVGVTGSGARLCNECVELCLEMIREEDAGRLEPEPTRPIAADAGTEEQQPVLARSQRPVDSRSMASPELIAAIRRALAEPSPECDQPKSCSFCDKARNDVKCLVAGNRVYVCDSCVRDAAMLMNVAPGA